jgi:hypothetical protein
MGEKEMEKREKEWKENGREGDGKKRKRMKYFCGEFQTSQLIVSEALRVF